MTRLTAEERRRIFLNRQQTDRDMQRRPSASPTTSEPMGNGPRLCRFVQMTLAAALMTVGWFVSQGIVFHVPASLAEMLPRL
jgi:hypothetical protein